ncbi:MAG: glucose-1-phosphate cytidylyltransferase [bacterium]|nr:glucose-1-phosphate cytidylyltransferase [bacterium]
MKVVVLCGGQGTRLREETEVKPKPMVEIGEMPILWHIMKTYANCGFDDFVLCLGYKGKVIKEFFSNYEMLTSDFSIDMSSGRIDMYPKHAEKNWKVTLVDTGLHSMTGSRVKRIEKFIDSDTFLLTYGDGVTDLDIRKVVDFHKSHGCIGTVTGVCPPSRYGELLIKGDHVVSFNEKPDDDVSSISGGYFVFDRRFFEYLSEDENCVLEREPLRKLAEDGELKVFNHPGFWQCMDTYRDYKYLNDLWETNKASWKVWND